MAFAITLVIPKALVPYLDVAITRLTYLFPSATFKADSAALSAEPGPNDDIAELRQAMAHTLYREKIYQETLDMRRDLVRALTS